MVKTPKKTEQQTLQKNYVTPSGYAFLQEEFLHLLKKDRPQTVETVRWAASNGDRSENGDYIYGKKRLREIDKRLRYLTKQIKNAKIVDPHLQKDLTQVFFGAEVTFEENKIETTLQIVGIDEADFGNHKISWTSPMAKALLKSTIGDVIKFKTPTASRTLKILKIKY